MARELHAIVRGRVQMVMYRDFVRRGANQLGITGTVQNLADGTVKVVAQGEEEPLKKFITRLKRGSLLSKVEAVEESWAEPRKTLNGFIILQ